MAEIDCSIVDVYAFRRGRDGVEVLLLRRAPGRLLGDTWQAVHGSIEADETAWQAALRELHEETGLRPLRFWQLETVNTFYMATRDCILMCPGFAAEVDSAARVRLNAEHSELRWAGVQEACGVLLWPGQRQAVRELAEVIAAGTAAEPHLRIDVPPDAGGKNSEKF